MFELWLQSILSASCRTRKGQPVTVNIIDMRVHVDIESPTRQTRLRENQHANGM